MNRIGILIKDGIWPPNYVVHLVLKGVPCSEPTFIHIGHIGVVLGDGIWPYFYGSFGP